MKAARAQRTDPANPCLCAQLELHLVPAALAAGAAHRSASALAAGGTCRLPWTDCPPAEPWSQELTALCRALLITGRKFLSVCSNSFKMVGIFIDFSKCLEVFPLVESQLSW